MVKLTRLVVALMVASLAVCIGSVQSAANDKIAQKRAERATFSWKSAKKISAFQDAKDLATAMDLPSDQVVSVSVGNSDLNGIGIYETSLGSFFPSKGNTFVVLSTGSTSVASLPNNSGSESGEIEGLNNSQGNDMVQITMVLAPPEGCDCLLFDFQYLSEEFPEFVGSQFNDAFTAEYGGTNLTIQNNEIIAPLNFAVDPEGNLITVNTVTGVVSNTGTTYDGSTGKLQAVTAVDSSTVTLVFTIQDLGDSIYDSAVFLDNFRWGYGDDCELKKLKYVALGDSYSSGQGIGEPYRGCKGDPSEDVCTNDKNNDCARHSLAYSTETPGGDENRSDAILAGQNVERFFYACSGAKTPDVIGPCSDGDKCSKNCSPDNVTQISRTDLEDADLITITIGGNDLGFADIIGKCLIGPKCENDNYGDSTVGEMVDNQLKALPETLKNTFNKINNDSGNKPLVVLGYPRFFHDTDPENDCDVPDWNLPGEFEPDNIVFLNSIAERLNNIIKDAALSIGATFVDVDKFFAGRFCCPDNEIRAINGFFVGKRFKDSFHPNAWGHLQFARITNNQLKKIMKKGELPTQNQAAETTPEKISEAEPPEPPPLDSIGELEVSVVDDGSCNIDSSGNYANGQKIRISGGGYAPNGTVTVKLYLRIEGGDQSTEYQVTVLQANNEGLINDELTLSTLIDAKGLARIEAYGNGTGGAQRILTALLSVWPSAISDGDNDGIPDICDLCPETASSDQTDSDMDGLGDICDPFPQDPDNDVDGDGLPAASDPCPFDKFNDADGDDFCASSDNCPNVKNFDQADSDLDGIGDACDDDPNPQAVIQLNPNWNLISLYVQPQNTSIGDVLSAISGKLSNAWAFQNNAWKVYDPNNPGFSDLSTMGAGWGYWLNMSEVGVLTVTGTEPSKSIALISGWNMVGYNCSTAQAIANALASIDGKVKSVWAYVNGAWKVYDPANPGFSDLTTMSPGYGFWIKTTEACTWTLP